MSDNSPPVVDTDSKQDSWSRSADDSDTSTDSEHEPTTSSDRDSDTEVAIAKNTVEPDIRSPENDAGGDGDSPDGSPSDTESDTHEIDVEPVDDYVDLAVMQVNYSTRKLGSSSQETGVVHLFCRTPDEDRDPVQVDVHNFDPYFYIDAKDESQLSMSDDRITGKKSGHKSIRGTPLTRVYTDVPSTVGKIRDEYDHYEADVLFPDRFMIDKGIKSGIRVPARWESENRIEVHDPDNVEPVDVSTEPRVHMMDIEVNDRNSFPEPEDAEEPILCITAHDSYTDEYLVWYFNDESRVTGEIPSSVDNYEFIDDHEYDVNIKKFSTEEGMLINYMSYIENTEADLMVGWNFDDFDAPYLINRLDKLDKSFDRDLNSDRLSRIGEVWSGGWHGPNIKGRVVFDLLEAYKRTQFSELDSYRLDAIGEIELDIGKERFDGKIGDLWENDPERLIEYNLRDVEICVELDEQEEVINFWDEVRQFVGCRIQDAPIPGDAVDMYVLHKVNGKFVLPSKGTVETGEDYEGGSVFDPMTGIEEMVTVLDLKSLYPMCMVTINASPETKVENPEEYDGETFKSPNGIHYRKDEDGIIREMVSELLGERDKKKELRSQYEPGDDEYKLYDKQQGAVKVIMNSLYGTLGWDRFRLYDKDNAAAVTATGRGVIEFTEKTVEKMGYEVTYGDTDSVMISLGDLTGIDAEISDEVRKKGPDWTDNELRELQVGLNKSFEIEDHINEAYNDYALENLNAEEHSFLIEFEKLYKRFLQAGKKKRYAGSIVWKESKFVDDIDITGFEYKRSDISDITKTSQKKLITMLVRGEDIDDVQTYLHDLISDFRDGEISVDQIGMPSGIGKELDNYKTETAHVRGAHYANLLLGANFGQGSKPKRVYLDRVRADFYQRVEEDLGITPRTNPRYADFKRDPDVICFIHADQIPDEFEVDWDVMLNKTLQGPLSRVLKAVDLTWDDVKSGQQQTGLGNFM